MGGIMDKSGNMSSFPASLRGFSGNLAALLWGKGLCPCLAALAPALLARCLLASKRLWLHRRDLAGHFLKDGVGELVDVAWSAWHPAILTPGYLFCPCSSRAN